MFNKKLLEICIKVFNRAAKYKLFPFESKNGEYFTMAKSNLEIFWNNSIIIHLLYICVQITQIKGDENIFELCLAFLYFLAAFLATIMSLCFKTDPSSLCSFYGEILRF